MIPELERMKKEWFSNGAGSKLFFSEDMRRLIKALELCLSVYGEAAAVMADPDGGCVTFSNMTFNDKVSKILRGEE